LGALRDHAAKTKRAFEAATANWSTPLRLDDPARSWLFPIGPPSALHPTFTPCGLWLRPPPLNQDRNGPCRSPSTPHLPSTQLPSIGPCVKMACGERLVGFARNLSQTFRPAARPGTTPSVLDGDPLAKFASRTNSLRIPTPETEAFRKARQRSSDRQSPPTNPGLSEPGNLHSAPHGAQDETEFVRHCPSSRIPSPSGTASRCLPQNVHAHSPTQWGRTGQPHQHRPNYRDPHCSLESAATPPNLGSGEWQTRRDMRSMLKSASSFQRSWQHSFGCRSGPSAAGAPPVCIGHACPGPWARTRQVNRAGP